MRCLRAREHGELSRQGTNLFLAIGLSLLIALPWYVSKLTSYGRTHGLAIIIGEIIPRTSPSGALRFIFDLALFTRDLLGDLVFWLFLSSIILCTIKGKEWRAFFCGWIIPPLLIFFVFGGRHAACIYQGIDFAGLLPGVAILTAYATIRCAREGAARLLPERRRLLPLIVLCVVALHLIQFIGVNLAGLGGLPGLRGEGFTRWARFGCMDGGTCSGSTCVEFDHLNNRAPNPFDFSAERLVYSIAGMRGEVNVVYFHRQGAFTSYMHQLLKERENLFKDVAVRDSACVDTPAVATSHTKPEGAFPCSELLEDAEVVVLEGALGTGQCTGIQEQVWPGTHEMLASLPWLLEEFDVVYTVRLMPSASIRAAPRSAVYLENETTLVSSLGERGVREPLDELLAVVLVRGVPAREVTVQERRLLEKWLLKGCEMQDYTQG